MVPKVIYVMFTLYVVILVVLIAGSVLGLAWLAQQVF
jgi:hypothetical protein